MPAAGSMPDNSNINNSIAEYIEAMALDTEGTLKSIDLTLKSIARKDGLIISQSSLRDLAEHEKRNTARGVQGANSNSQGGQFTRNPYRGDSANRNGAAGTDGDKPKVNKNTFDKITKDFENEFKKALFGTTNPMADAMQKAVSQFAKSLDTDVANLGKTLGKKLGQIAKNSPMGKELEKELNWVKQKTMGMVNNGLSKASTKLGGTGDIDLSNVSGDVGDAVQESMDAVADDINNAAQANTQTVTDNMNAGFQGVNSGLQQIYQAIISSRSTNDFNDFGNSISDSIGDVIDVSPEGEVTDITKITDLGSNILDVSNEFSAVSESTELMVSGATEAAETLPALASGTAEAGAGMAVAAEGAAAASVAFPWLAGAIAIGAIALDAFSEAFGPAIEGFKKFGSALSNAANRTQTQNSKNLELWKNRVAADVKSATEAAFNVIEESAKTALATWDEVSGTIAAAQGYTKEGVQDLWSNFASTLKDKGLQQYVSSADIMKNLESVLQQGLYGAAAEAFALEATILNKAVPNQDFFQYASTYASIAANAERAGASQEQAIEIANTELESFASNLLYASREIAGGFSTNLQNGAQLFADAAKIAQSSQIESADVSDISGVLTSASAIVSAMAPDLADGIISAIVDAATGGNSSTITALRSMAGTGASNTAFLQALAKDPQKVFATLFKNLAELQNMSSQNYMEVAEGLSQVFGMSMEAFTRVDFNYLASAISEMSLNNKSLNENMALLSSGETTSTAEQLRMQKINEYMIDEGLAYVLDSEVGRAVQEHMWEEQLMREIEENTFAVELTGGALEFLQGIFQTVENIINFLNPLSWLKGLGNIALSFVEAATMNQDIMDTVVGGAVGKGNSTSLAALFPSGPTDYRDAGLLDLDYKRWVTGTASATEELRQGGMKTWQLGSGQLTLGDIFTASAASTVGKSAIQSSQAEVKQRYGRRLVSGQASSGDWRDDAGYNSTWQERTDEGGLQKDTVAMLRTRKKVKDKNGKETWVYEEDSPEAYSKMSDTEKQKRATSIQNALTASMSEYVAEASKRGSEDLNKYMSTDTVKVFDKQFISINRIAQNAINYATGKGKKYEDLIVTLREFGTSEKGQTYLTQEQILAKLDDISSDLGATDTEVTFEEWATKTYGMSLEKLSEALINYGTDIQTLAAQFDQIQSKESAKQQKARDLHEVQFWEDMQRFATDLFPEYLNEWKKYYILNTAYTEQVGAAQVEAMNAALTNQTKTEDAVLELAQHLTSNDIWKDVIQGIANPAVQTNMLLSKILIYVQAIMQQNNETSIVSVPTALSALGLGLTNTTGDTKSKDKK